MGRGNKAIDKLMVKTIFEDNILIPLPKVFVENRLFPLFSIISPIHCDFCNTKLNVNSHYTRFILTSYGTITRNTTYWICPNCKKSFHDQIVGVTGSANYSDEFYDKQKFVRYDGRSSLNNSCRIGGRYTEGLTDICGRAPCASSLWLHEQKQSTVSKQELLDLNPNFDGTLYIDGDWVKKGWKKKLETLIGREVTLKEWKKMRYQSVYVIATKEKIILDFEVTDRLPPIEALTPLLMRIKNRFPEGKIQKIVSDEDKAIIGAVVSVFPEVVHSFCVFHQLKNVSRRYRDEFESVTNIPGLCRNPQFDANYLYILFVYVIDYQFNLNFFYLVPKLPCPKCLSELSFYYREYSLSYVPLIVLNSIKAQIQLFSILSFNLLPFSLP